MAKPRGRPGAGVATDLGELLVGEAARLVEDLVGHRQLAHVMQHAAMARTPATPTTAICNPAASMNMWLPEAASSSVGISAASSRTTPTGRRVRI
jgi:hypothetical protein